MHRDMYTRPRFLLHEDPHGLMRYLDIDYHDLAREIERARFQRKLERLEDEYAAAKKKKRTTRKKKSKKTR